MRHALLMKCVYQIKLQTREMLRVLPSLVDVSIAEGKHFTVCGDVHGQIRKLAVNSLLRSNQINEIFLEHMNKLAFMRLVHVHLGFICSYQSIIAILYEGLTRHLKAKVSWRDSQNILLR
ncbi:uncharacterized protein LOC113356999 [Papaver somniferum]|uniref:uncharacterized protein LOC113356999 n=1 Tax=Papaver somniferum TaxID=3469 RepID=UPI000E6FDC10|nr:uncharacterized protein LOC113356999 [Papaver somniferum]